jgi:8-oxo-dGTP pyrophosphatase MutT (NUDIX family)
MKELLSNAWSDFVSPLLKRPRSHQVAALCWRDGAPDAGREVLLITSRDTGRWVIPKGWPMKRKTGAGAALQEAWEEAGVEAAEIDETPLGAYRYDKALDNGLALPCRVEVFAARVLTLADEWPERGQRTREWVSARIAADRVAEPELSALLRAFGG